MPKCLGNAQTSRTLGQILGEHAVEKILSDVISTNLHLYVMKLWYSFFDIFVSGEVGNAQTWEVMALKKPIKPLQWAKIFPSIFLQLAISEAAPKTHPLEMRPVQNISCKIYMRLV